MKSVFYRKKLLRVVYGFCLLVMSCNSNTPETPSISNQIIQQTDSIPKFIYPYDTTFHNNETYIADQFDFPIGKPNAKGYYDAQPFMKNNHLGEDWNAVTGGNSDLGDPIFAIANGYVTDAKDYKGGWGNVIRIVHKLDKNAYPYLESLYAHCNEILVKKGQFVQKGDQIATIGNAHGIYYAHLHFELRHEIDMPLGGGYSTDTTGFLEPKVFIKKNSKQ